MSRLTADGAVLYGALGSRDEQATNSRTTTSTTTTTTTATGGQWCGGGDTVSSGCRGRRSTIPRHGREHGLRWGRSNGGQGDRWNSGDGGGDGRHGVGRGGRGQAGRARDRGSRNKGLQRSRPSSRGRGDTAAGFVNMLADKQQAFIESGYHRVAYITYSCRKFPPEVVNVTAGRHIRQQIADGVGQPVHLVDKLGMAVLDGPDLRGQRLQVGGQRHKALIKLGTVPRGQRGSSAAGIGRAGLIEYWGGAAGGLGRGSGYLVIVGVESAVILQQVQDSINIRSRPSSGSSSRLLAFRLNL